MSTRRSRIVREGPVSRLLPVGDPERNRRLAIRRTNVAHGLQLGHVTSLRHGIYSEVAVRPEVLDECAMLFGRAPWLDPVRDGVLAESCARVIVRLRLLDAALDDAPTSSVLTSMYSRLEGELTRKCAALGLGPVAAASLGIVKLDAKARAARLTEDALAPYRPRVLPKGETS